jgi:hypothetical protein
VGFLIAVLIVSGALAAALGGRLRPLLETAIQWPVVLFAALAAQLVTGITQWEGAIEDAMFAILLLSYVALLLFTAVNRHVPGMALIGLGMALNGTVIAVNRGMPTELPRGARLEDTVKHHVRRPSDRLVVLSDVIVVRPIGESLSVGDMVLAAGVLRLVVTRSRTGGRD